MILKFEIYQILMVFKKFEFLNRFNFVKYQLFNFLQILNFEKFESTNFFNYQHSLNPTGFLTWSIEVFLVHPKKATVDFLSVNKLTPHANQLVICPKKGGKKKEAVNFHCPKRYCNALIDSLFHHYNTKGDFGRTIEKIWIKSVFRFSYCFRKKRYLEAAPPIALWEKYRWFNCVRSQMLKNEQIRKALGNFCSHFPCIYFLITHSSMGKLNCKEERKII